MPDTLTAEYVFIPEAELEALPRDSENTALTGRADNVRLRRGFFIYLPRAAYDALGRSEYIGILVDRDRRSLALEVSSADRGAKKVRRMTMGGQDIGAARIYAAHALRSIGLKSTDTQEIIPQMINGRMILEFGETEKE